MLKRGSFKSLYKSGTLLLVVLLILMIWGGFYIKNKVIVGSEERALGKFTIELEISQVQIIPNNTLRVVVKRNVGAATFNGINFTIEDGRRKETIYINSSLDELQYKIFLLPLNKINTSNLKKISIYPIFRFELKDRLGNKEDEYVFSKTDLEVCRPYCPSEFVCGEDGCGGECGSGCTQEGYACTDHKCIISLEERCKRVNVSIKGVSNATRNVFNGNLSVSLSRVGEEDIGGVILAFFDENETSNVVMEVPGNIISFTQENKFIVVLERHLKTPNKVRVVTYFLNNESEKELCRPSKPFAF